MTQAPQVALILARAALEERLQDGDERSWVEYRESVGLLARLMEHRSPARLGQVLTTREMAERLNVSPKTLLKHKARGAVEPAAQRGKWVRWRGDEMPR